MRIFCIFLLLLAASVVQAQAWKKLARTMQQHRQPFFYYQFCGENDGKNNTLLASGDQLQIQYTLQTVGKKNKSGEILVSSYEQTTPVLVQLPTPDQDIFFTSALRLMRTGDSLRVLVPADSVREHLGEASRFFKRGQAVLFTYKVLNISPLAKVRQANAIDIARADSIRAAMRIAIYDFDKAEKSAAANLNFEQSASGLRYKIFAAGDEKKAAKAAKTVQVHYLCYLLDGTLLDDSYQTAQPIMLSANRQQFIKGWVEGIELLGEGGQAVLVIPPDLAYGEKGAGSMIPPNSTIIFWIEILHVAP
jgi:FKBP-type peptidyl-prolyl cis-trans isomerase